MSGKKSCEVSKDYDLEVVKQRCKDLNVTINDYFTASIGVTLQKYFKMFNSKTNEVIVSIPINIRFTKPIDVKDI